MGDCKIPHMQLKLCSNSFSVFSRKWFFIIGDYQSTDSISLILPQILILKWIFFILSTVNRSYIIWRKTLLGCCFFLTDKDTKVLVTCFRGYGHKGSVQSFPNTKYVAVCIWNATSFLAAQPLENASLNSSKYHFILFAGILGFAQMTMVQRVRIIWQRNAPLSLHFHLVKVTGLCFFYLQKWEETVKAFYTKRCHI